MPAVSRPLPGIAAANREVLARMVAADPVLLDCVPAGDALGLNTGIARRRAGTGQVGAGPVRAPLACFTDAPEALARARGAA
jgi:hypothetical protein